MHLFRLRNVSVLALTLGCSGAMSFASQQAPPLDQPLPQTLSFKKLGRASIEMSSGETTLGGDNDKTASLASTFINTDTSGFYGVGPVNSSSGDLIEWLDWGTLTTDTGSDIVGGFTFGYGTSVTDPTLGGPGAQITVRFYGGIFGYCADSGASPCASFSYTGLPGAPGGGASAGWLISVDLQGGFEFCCGSAGDDFGFGFTTSDDYDINGTRDTGPILCFAGDGAGGKDSNGQENQYDQWEDTPASNICLGTFNFGPPPSDFASWYLDILTPDVSGSTLASAAFINGSGCNPVKYSVIDLPVLSKTFKAEVETDCNGAVAILEGWTNCWPGGHFPSMWGDILIQPFSPSTSVFSCTAPFAAGVATFEKDLPKDLTLCGLKICTQAIEVGCGSTPNPCSGLFKAFRLFNGWDLTVGF